MEGFFESSIYKLPPKVRYVFLALVFFVTGGVLVHKLDYLDPVKRNPDMTLMLITAGLFVLGIIMIILLIGDFSKDKNRKLLAYGLVTSTRDGMRFDKLHAGGQTKDGLRNNWNIVDAASAKETLDWLQTGAHSTDYNQVWKEFIADKENAEKFPGLFDVRSKLLGNYPVKESDIDNITTLLAWDTDRLIAVARWCYAGGYVTKDEAWSYINKAKTTILSSYNSWTEYIVAVVYARTIWGSYEELSGSDMEVLDKLLLDGNNISNKVQWGK